MVRATKEYLGSLKPGDTFKVWMAGVFEKTISRVSAEHIFTTDGQRFSKRTGQRLVASKLTAKLGNPYQYVYIVLPDDFKGASSLDSENSGGRDIPEK